MALTRYPVKQEDNAVKNLEPGDVGFWYHHPFEDDKEYRQIPSVWGSLKKRLIALGVILDARSYISTTETDLQADSNQKFQIDKAGNLLLPTTPNDGEIIRVVDFNKKLISQHNYVLALGEDQTIGAGQVKDVTKITNAIDLHQLQGWEIFDFVYYESAKNWGILLDGISRRFNLPQPTERPYVYTTTADLKITPYAMVGIDQPGNILLWTPTQVGEYATITDARALLPTQDVFVVAPDGHSLGVGVVPSNKISTTINLRNNRGANWFRVAYLGDQKWEINWVTKNG